MKYKTGNVSLFPFPAVFLCLFVFLVTASAQDTAQQAKLRQWIEERLDPSYTGIPEGKGVTVEYTTTRTSWIPLSELNSRWDKVKKYPDHPDRDTYETLLKYIHHPETAKCRITFAGPYAWTYQTESVSGSSDDNHPENSYKFSFGGLHDTRWLLSSNTLSIVHAGIPFPLYNNPGGMLDTCNNILNLLLKGGLSHFPPSAELSDISIHNNKWQVEIQWNLNNTYSIVFGHYNEDNINFVDHIDNYYKKRKLPVKTVFRNYIYSGYQDIYYPSEITWDQSMGQRVLIKVSSLSFVSRSKAEQEGKLPKTTSRIKVIDFTKEYLRKHLNNNSDDISPEPLITWEQKNGVDYYLTSDDPRSLKGSSSSASEKNTETNSQKHVADKSAKKLAITAILLVIIAFAIIIYLLQHRNR